MPSSRQTSSAVGCKKPRDGVMKDCRPGVIMRWIVAENTGVLTRGGLRYCGCVVAVDECSTTDHICRLLDITHTSDGHAD